MVPALLPAPAAAQQAETVTGEVVRAWAESEDGHALPDTGTTGDGDGHGPELLTWIDTADDMVPVETERLEHVPVGAQVRARLGIAAGDAPSVEEPERPVLAAQVLGEAAEPEPESVAAQEQELAAGSAAHTVSIVLAVPAGGTTDSMTTTALAKTVTGPVSSFWSEQTGGRVSYTVDRTRSWVQLSAPCSDAGRLWSQAASSVGFTPGPGKHLLVYVSPKASLSQCYSGLGTVGSGITDGGKAYVRTGLTSLVAHELGHNLGLGHSDGVLCSKGSDGSYDGGAWGSGCTQHGYRDPYDVMGISWSQIGSLSTAHADQLGVLGSGTHATRTPTRVTLAPVSGLAGVRSLRVTDPAGGTYYVEYRPASRRDSYITAHPEAVQAGVLVRRRTSTHNTVLLDGTPTGSTSDWSQALPVGRTLTTASRRVSITVEGVTSAGAVIAVAVDGAQPPKAPPTFHDVPPDAYFHAPVTWAAKEGITAGTSPTTFSPHTVVTRAQAVSLLWRSAGEPPATVPTTTFVDVPASAYYRDAVAWASGEGVTSGTSAGRFNPSGQLTREQAVTLMWRMAGEPTPTGVTSFSDVAPGSYSETAIAWAKQEGITSGTSPVAFSPGKSVTRAEIVTFLHRMLVA